MLIYIVNGFLKNFNIAVLVLNSSFRSYTEQYTIFLKYRQYFITREATQLTSSIVNSNKIKVLLSASDMEAFGITYSQLDYANEETRFAINDILTQVKIELGFESAGYRLFVEVFKSDDGGCTFYFTRTKPNIKDKIQNQTDKPLSPNIIPVTLKFDNLNALCDYSRFISEFVSLPTFGSNLYIMDGIYYLVIFIFKLQYNKFILTANEFSISIYPGKVFYAHVNEHGKKLIEEKAVENMVNI